MGHRDRHARVAQEAKSLTDVLVVAGEPSGDRAAARVAARLHDLGARTFGLAGASCERAGMELDAHIDRSTALGVLDVASRAAHVALAMRAVRAAVSRRKPRAALLVNYTEFNAQILGFLRRNGVKVAWYAAPQIWAWRPRRGRAIARGIDAMAVILPFEEALWREHGARARYVGHPAMEGERLDRAHARSELDLASDAHAIAIMPGSRSGEVRRLLPAMLECVVMRRETEHARVLLTTSLDRATFAWARARAHDANVGVTEIEPSHGATRVLSAFDVSLCASGTASLESVMAGAPPVVAYRLDALAAFVAKHAMRTPHVALPNVLLGRRAFPELLQTDATSTNMSRALDDVMRARARSTEDCLEVSRVLGEGHVPSRAVAEMITPWL